MRVAITANRNLTRRDEATIAARIGRPLWVEALEGGDR